MAKLTEKEYKLFKYLKDEPLARERKNKNRALVNLLLKEYGWILRGLESGLLTKETLTNFVNDILYFDRKWRRLLETYPELQGNDYNTKKRVVQKAQIELGYEPNFYKDIKEQHLS